MLTDFGGARRRLAALVGAVSSGIAGGFIATLGSAGTGFEGTQDLRREQLRRVIALDPVIDQAFGESSELRYYSPVLQRGVGGLYVALAAWRTASVLLSRLTREQAREVANSVLPLAPPELRADSGTDWLERPVTLRASTNRAARKLMTMPAETPAFQLLADKTAAAFSGLSRALDALALLMANPRRRAPRRRGIRRLDIPDWLPALVNGGRTFVTVASMALFWVVTAWPGGAQGIVFAAIVSILMAPRADQAYAAAFLAVIGIILDLILTATINYAVLPGLGVETFAGLSLVLAICLVPLGVLLSSARQPWQVGMFTAMATIFMPLLAPTNQMSYDVATFYNAALGIVVGACGATLAFRLIPPLSPAYRTRRLLDLALSDLRRLLRRRVVSTIHAWDDRGTGRLSALPDSAEPLQRARLLAAVLTGAEVIRLRRGARRFGLDVLLDAALMRLASGDVAGATEGLAQLDQRLEARQTPAAIRARARILAISGALTQHPAYFELLANA